jgi:beta-lactamase regulating signal transducer with metallopeptidase domain
MSTLLHGFPGDQVLEFLAPVILSVALASSVACMIARRLTGRAALRHLVLLAAVVVCLASPAVVWFCTTTGLALIAIPVLGTEQTGEDKPLEIACCCTPSQQSTGATTAPAEPPGSRTDAAFNPGRSLVCPETNPGASPSAPSALEVPGAPESEEPPRPLRSVVTVLMFVWGAGALLMLARLAWQWGRVMQLRRCSLPLADESRQGLQREIAASLRMRRVPPLLVSSRTVVPLAVGLRRPAVILPRRLLGAIHEDELRDVLVHELAHLQRGDPWILLLQGLAGALYWPIVSVHALHRELQRAREEVCDNVVLADRDPIHYGETLLHVAELLVKVRSIRAAAGILGGPGKLERRIAGLIDSRRNAETRPGRKAAGVVLCLFLALVALAATTRFATSVRADAAQPANMAQAECCPASPSVPTPEVKLAGHFNGRVNGPDGKPLRGARVFLVPAQGASKEAGKVRATTGADGRFSFDAPDMTFTNYDGLPGRRKGFLSATAEGLGVDGMPTWGQEPGPQTQYEPIREETLNLQVVRDDVPLHGRFLDAAGRPLAGARVQLTRLKIPEERGLDVYLAFAIPASLVTEIPFKFRDLDAASLPGLSTETRTDAEGRFELSGLGRDRLVELRVEAPSVVDTRIEAMTRDGPDVGTYLVDGQPTQIIHGASFTLKLGPGRTIKGRVLDWDSRKALAGMRVE